MPRLSGERIVGSKCLCDVVVITAVVLVIAAGLQDGVCYTLEMRFFGNDTSQELASAVQGNGFRVKVGTIAACGEREVGVLVLDVVTDCVFDGSGECELCERVGCRYFDAVQCLGDGVGSDDVGFVLVGEWKAVDAVNGVDGSGEAVVKDLACGE